MRAELHGHLEKALSEQASRFAARLEEHSGVMLEHVRGSLATVREEVQSAVTLPPALQHHLDRWRCSLEAEVLATLEDRVGEALGTHQDRGQRQHADTVEGVKQQLRALREEAKQDRTLLQEELALLSSRLAEKAKLNAENIVTCSEQLQQLGARCLTLLL